MSREEFSRKTNVSRETLERLDIYAALLRQWTPKINLVSPSTLEALWTRHFLDSAQILEYAPSARHWADIGSGGGFPGAVIAILAAELRPEMTLSLVESDQRKAVFLRTVFRSTGLSGDVISHRAEDVEPLAADVLSARALAPLSQLLSLAERHLTIDGVCLFLKGKKADQEISDALEGWSFRCEKYKSQTDAEAVVLRIGDVDRV